MKNLKGSEIYMTSVRLAHFIIDLYYKDLYFNTNDGERFYRSECRLSNNLIITSEYYSDILDAILYTTDKICENILYK
jgi:hypothetical protein